MIIKMNDVGDGLCQLSIYPDTFGTTRNRWKVWPCFYESAHIMTDNVLDNIMGERYDDIINGVRRGVSKGIELKSNW